MIIVIEGPDGAGKSTLANNLKDRFQAEGKQVVMVREPGTTIAGERIRDVFKNTANLLPATQLFLIAASRAENVRFINETILASKERCAPEPIFIIDRWIHSTIAYQGYYFNLPIKKVLDVLYMTNCFSLNVDHLVRLSTDLVKPADGAVEETFSDRKRLHECMRQAFEFDIGAESEIDINTSENTTPTETANTVFDVIQSLKQTYGKDVGDKNDKTN